MARKLSVIIVPDEGGHSRRLTLSVFWLKTLAGFGIILLIFVLIGAVTWGKLVQQALEYSSVKAENSRLEKENQDIIRVAREVDQSRKVLAQIIRSLGGHLDLGRPVDETDSVTLGDAMKGSELYYSGSESDLSGSFQLETVLTFCLPTQIPAEGFISQKFLEDHLFPERSHRGIDIAAKAGSAVVAAAPGRVVFSSWTPHFGNCVIIAHSNGYLTFYGHNQINLKSVREEVMRGETIALLGTSGKSSAPHVHFEIWKDGMPVDPLEFIRLDEDQAGDM